MLRIEEILSLAVRLGASDVHLTAGSPPALRIHGELLPFGAREWQEKYKINLGGMGRDEGAKPDTGALHPLTADDTDKLCRQIMNEDQYWKFNETGEHDFSLHIPETGRFRVNAFRQRGAAALALRLINDNILSFEELGLPVTLADLARKPRGLVLVTGPTGSGKSTTLAAMIDLINREYRKHIITLEDPIEFIHRHKNSIVNQREIGSDSRSFAAALRAALREDPDVILVGEMRDPETIGIAITAAETGHLVLATLHTSSAAQTIDRIIDVFPPHQQQQIRIQLAGTIQGVVAQQLIPRVDRPGRVVAVELMVANHAIKNLIREGKTHQIVSQMQTGARYGMQTMDAALYKLYKEGVISRQEILSRAMNSEIVTKIL